MLDLQHHIMVDYALGGVACDAACDYAQILCRYVQQVGIITHVARFTVAALQRPHATVGYTHGAPPNQAHTGLAHRGYESAPQLQAPGSP